MRLPPWPFTRAIMIRSTVLWIPVRLAATAVVAMVPPFPGLPPAPSPWVLSPWTTLAVLLVVTALTWLDCVRRNETVFLANLGVSRVALLGLAATMPLLLSITTAVLVRS